MHGSAHKIPSWHVQPPPLLWQSVRILLVVVITVAPAPPFGGFVARRVAY